METISNEDDGAPYFLAGLLSTMYETDKHPEEQLVNAVHILRCLRERAEAKSRTYLINQISTEDVPEAYDAIAMKNLPDILA